MITSSLHNPYPSGLKIVLIPESGRETCAVLFPEDRLSGGTGGNSGNSGADGGGKNSADGNGAGVQDVQSAPIVSRGVYADQPYRFRIVGPDGSRVDGLEQDNFVHAAVRIDGEPQRTVFLSSGEGIFLGEGEDSAECRPFSEKSASPKSPSACRGNWRWRRDFCRCMSGRTAISRRSGR